MHAQFHCTHCNSYKVKRCNQRSSSITICCCHKLVSACKQLESIQTDKMTDSNWMNNRFQISRRLNIIVILLFKPYEISVPVTFHKILIFIIFRISMLLSLVKIAAITISKRGKHGKIHGL